MLLRRLTEEHFSHVRSLLQDQVHERTAICSALRDLYIQDLVLVDIQGEIVLKFCGHIRSDDTFQIDIRPGRSCGVVHSAAVLFRCCFRCGSGCRCGSGFRLRFSGLHICFLCRLGRLVICAFSGFCGFRAICSLSACGGFSACGSCGPGAVAGSQTADRQHYCNSFCQHFFTHSQYLPF